MSLGILQLVVNRLRAQAEAKLASGEIDLRVYTAIMNIAAALEPGPGEPAS